MGESRRSIPISAELFYKPNWKVVYTFLNEFQFISCGYHTDIKNMNIYLKVLLIYISSCFIVNLSIEITVTNLDWKWLYGVSGYSLLHHLSPENLWTGIYMGLNRKPSAWLVCTVLLNYSLTYATVWDTSLIHHQYTTCFICTGEDSGGIPHWSLFWYFGGRQLFILQWLCWWFLRQAAR